MASNCSDRSIGDSLISGIELQIGKSFIPPPKVILPLSYDFGTSSDVLFMNYDFSLENQVVAWSENERKQREASAERLARAPAAAEASVLTSDTEEDDSATMSIEPAALTLPNGRLPHHNINTNAAVHTSVAQFNHVAVATATASNASSHHGDILTPTLVKPQAKQQDKKHEPTINLADFEREEDPFDKVELKTINDMEVLHTVLQTTLPTLAAHNGMVPACTGDSIHNRNNDPVLPGRQSVPLPDIPATRCLVQTPQTVSALSQSTTQHMSASYPQCVPTTTNQDTVEIYSTGSVKYSPVPDGRTVVPHTITSSRSSPDISNNVTHATSRVIRGSPAYTPPPYPTRVQTPPPRPSHLQDADKEWSTQQPLPSQAQGPCRNGTSDVYHPPLSQAAVTLIRRVTDMGFPKDRVERAVRCLGNDDKKVVDYLCLADQLVQQGYKIDDVETSLELFDNDVKKVALYLQLLTRFREIGFAEDKIQGALVRSDLDEGRAIDCLTEM